MNTDSLPGAPQLLPRSTDPSPASSALRDFFVAFELGGGAGVLLVLATVLLVRAPRLPTWISFCVAWIVSSISYSLLYLTGHQRGPQPPFELCLTQAVLIYVAPVLNAYTSLAMILQLSQITSTLSFTNKYDRPCPRLTLTLVTGPWIIVIPVAIDALMLGLENPQTVRRTELYCGITTGVPRIVSSVLTIGAMIAGLALECVIATHLYRSWHAFRRFGGSAPFSLSLLARVGIFTVCAVAAVGVSAAFAASVRQTAPNVLLAIMPVVVFIVFGTQEDVLRAWAFWLPPKPPSAPVTLQAHTQSASMTEV